MGTEYLRVRHHGPLKLPALVGHDHEAVLVGFAKGHIWKGLRLAVLKWITAVLGPPMAPR